MMTKAEDNCQEPGQTPFSEAFDGRLPGGRGEELTGPSVLLHLSPAHHLVTAPRQAAGPCLSLPTWEMGETRVSL